MALINRLTRLVKADFHAVLDNLEEPEQVLKQAIRDMEDELADAEQRIILCAKDQETLEQRIRELKRSAEEINTQLDLCFESGKDALAKSMIRKKLEAERILQRLVSKYDGNAKFLSDERKALAENGATLEGLRQKAELFSQRTSSRNSFSAFDDVTWLSRDLQVGDEEIEIEFLRLKEARAVS